MRNVTPDSVSSNADEGKHVRVLLVDDDPGFVVSTSGMLSREARLDTVGVAFSGTEAIELAERYRPDIVLLDYVLPDMSGADVVRRLKKQSRPPAVVMVSGLDTPEFQENSIVAGADAFMPKMHVAEDFPRIAEILTQPRGELIGELEIQAKSKLWHLNREVTIAVWEPDPMVLHHISALLRGEGFCVLPHRDESALVSAIESTSLELLVIGPGVPSRNGFQLCQRLKTDPGTRNIAVAHLCSEDTQPADLAEIHPLHRADTYSFQPPSRLTLLSEVNALLRLSATAGNAVPPPPRTFLSPRRSIASGVSLAN